MVLHTTAREIPARWIRVPDQVAVFSAGGTPVRTADVAAVSAGVVWLDVVQAPALVAGDAGAWVIVVAERLPDGRHGPLRELWATDGETYVVRERLAVARDELRELLAGVVVRQSPFDALDYALFPDDGEPLGAALCGQWVDYGPCARRMGHAERCATRNEVLSERLAGDDDAGEGHPPAAGGITPAPVAWPAAAPHALPAPRREQHEEESARTP